MRIAFFGLVNSFSAGEVGGNNSLVRRIAFRLTEIGVSVDCVEYGASEAESFEVSPGVWHRSFRSLGESLRWLADDYDHIISIYLKPRDRVSFAFFRKRHKRRTVFHHLYTGLNESRLKRKLLFADARLWPFNGCLFSISPRMHRLTGKWARRRALLFPPVPTDYFLSPEEKPKSDKLRLTYAGRLDTGKGVVDAIEVFQRLAKHPHIQARICGYPWQHDSESMRLHDSLLADSDIMYEPVSYRQWMPSVDRNLCNLLRQTDILLLPYRRLSSTIDMPLLLLEGMANLCAVLTPALGDIAGIYGESPFSLHNGWDADKVTEMILNARQHLSDERLRLFRQCRTLAFDTESITDKFRRELLDDIYDNHA